MQNVNHTRWGLGPGQSVLVPWSDGGEYPAQVLTVHGDQILCRFPNGTETWIPSASVRPATQAPAVQQPGGAQPAGISAALGNQTSGNVPQRPARKSRNPPVLIALAFAGAVVTLALAVILIRGKDSWPLSVFDEDAAVASLALEASEAMLAAALGKPHDSKWNGPDPSTDLRGTEAGVRTAIGSAPKVALVGLILGAHRPLASGHDSLKGQAAVVNGRLRWFNVRRSAFSFPALRAKQGLEEAAPVLASASRRLLEATGKACSLPVLTRDEIATLPANVQGELLREAGGIPKACVTGDVSPDWVPEVEGIAVLMEANGAWVSLQSSLDVEAGKIRLGRVRMRPLQRGADTSAASTPTAPSTPPLPPSGGAIAVGMQALGVGVGGKPSSGRVDELYGKLARFTYASGDVEWIYLSKMTPAGTPLPDPRGDSCSVLVGQRVKAPWPYEKGRKFVARVGEVYGKLARVTYQDDGKNAWAACEDCDPVF